ncbi:uncharacterized protein EI97DRAFT_443505 [Westerdykella ornata]|uniref:Secreted protein n=1 Tax=Westerdykella ornata TaxID=318751 RepID=A0A6A6JFT0_WESOR|nr:uncharacterized protein EI97DRAFT_443505 [Westerdykella ornata]KAF2275272.1 hypothetical protein EI97DRAFT_443505 [Westerdykella ornata]
MRTLAVPTRRPLATLHLVALFAATTARPPIMVILDVFDPAFVGTTQVRVRDMFRTATRPIRGLAHVHTASARVQGGVVAVADAVGTLRDDAAAAVYAEGAPAHGGGGRRRWWWFAIGNASTGDEANQRDGGPLASLAFTVV